MKALAAIAWGASLALGSSAVSASQRQLHLGPALGFAWRAGPQGGVGGFAAFQGAYDVTDAFRIYATAAYVLGANDAANTPRHEGNAAAGVVYVIDVVTVTPWFGVGGQAAFVATPQWNGWVPSVQLRGGLDYLVSRYFALTLHLSYDIAVANRDRSSDGVNASVGLRWTLDL